MDLDALESETMLVEYKTMGNHLLLLDTLVDHVIKTTPFVLFHPKLYERVYAIKNAIAVARSEMLQEIQFPNRINQPNIF